MGGYFGAWEDENSNVVDSVLGYAFRFDPECIGDNVEPYSCRIEGDGAYFGPTGSKDGIPEEFFPDGSFHAKKYECSDSLLVTKENRQELDPGKSFVPLIVLTLPIDDEFRSAYDRARSLEHTDASEYDYRIGQRIRPLRRVQRFAKNRRKHALRNSRLRGWNGRNENISNSPVEDFEERYLAFQELRDECILEELEGEPRDSTCSEDPELYTIAQLS